MTIKYFLFDCETGGLNPDRVNLLTLSGLILDNNLEVQDSINLKIKPNDGIYCLESKAMEVNSIPLIEHNKTAIVEYRAAEKLEKFLAKHIEGRNRFIAAGHNVYFDLEFMKKLVGPESLDKYFTRVPLDTITIARFLCLSGLIDEKRLNGLSLKNLVAYFDHKYENAHDAAGDVQMTLKVLKSMRELLSNKQKGTK